jgi:hypothetical protein
MQERACESDARLLAGKMTKWPGPQTRLSKFTEAAGRRVICAIRMAAISRHLLLLPLYHHVFRQAQHIRHILRGASPLPPTLDALTIHIDSQGHHALCRPAASRNGCACCIARSLRFSLTNQFLGAFGLVWYHSSSLAGCHLSLMRV